MLTCGRRRFALRRHGQAGVSLVELMVGVAVGLFIVAATSLMTSAQLSENRRLVLETQLHQDLRATVDIITKELRRASYFNETAQHLWYEGRSAPVVENHFGVITPVSGSDLEEIEFKYRRRSGDQGPFGFRINSGAIQTRVAAAYQNLTDTRIMRVTAMSIDLAEPESFRLPCPRLCPDGSENCWPELQLRTARVTVTASSATDPSITRTVASTVRMRNDYTKFNGAEVCPA